MPALIHQWGSWRQAPSRVHVPPLLPPLPPRQAQRSAAHSTSATDKAGQVDMIGGLTLKTATEWRIWIAERADRERAEPLACYNALSATEEQRVNRKAPGFSAGWPVCSVAQGKEENCFKLTDGFNKPTPHKTFSTTSTCFFFFKRPCLI